MTDDDVRDQLFSIIRNTLGSDTLTLTLETSAQDVPGWDSLKQVMIIVAVEERFAIRLSSREIDALHCVGDLHSLIIQKTAGAL